SAFSIPPAFCFSSRTDTLAACSSKAARSERWTVSSSRTPSVTLNVVLQVGQRLSTNRERSLGQQYDGELRRNLSIENADYIFPAERLTEARTFERDNAKRIGD